MHQNIAESMPNQLSYNEHALCQGQGAGNKKLLFDLNLFVRVY